jgi:DNA-binding NarL/FixJ family response regulator
VTGPVRVVIADDHPMFREGLAGALLAVPELEVVGAAPDGEQLIALVDRTEPDVVLTDLAMPGLGGAAATRQILERHPHTQVIVLTMHDDDEAIYGALRAGARGYLLKGADRDEIVRTVLEVAAGGSVFGGGVGQRITTFFTSTQQQYSATVFPDLTAREREILDLMAKGLGNHEIARRLFLSEKTIRNNVASVLTKLQVNDRAAAAAKAREAGLGQGS